MAAFALTEPGAGSDAAATRRAPSSPTTAPTTAQWLEDLVTNGAFADVFTASRAPAPWRRARSRKITAFIVGRGPGLTNGPNEHKLGIRGSSTTELFLEDVIVPRENVLGEVGKGFKVAMEVLNNGRLGLASGCIGLSLSLLKMALARVQERRAFGRNIGEFGLIKDQIAHLLSQTYGAGVGHISHRRPRRCQGRRLSLRAPSARSSARRPLWSVVNETLQIARHRYMQEYPYERMLRDARIT